jgi:hypothetical protein
MMTVAVLGAGIMGSSTALLLARRGATVKLYDAGNTPLPGASRWNEGKIHLGFLYSGDPSFETAERLMPGGLAFRPLVERLIGQSLAPAITHSDDRFLIHRDSVVPADAAAAYFTRLVGLVRTAPGASRYLSDVSQAAIRVLSRRELDAMARTEYITAGFVVPERSVSTRWVADAFVRALEAESQIEFIPMTTVRAVQPENDSLDGPFSIETTTGVDGPFDVVVNALWEGRLGIDERLGLRPAWRWSHRYRRCLFVRTVRPVDVPSVVICTGPFGDVKRYGPREFYLSWYPAGLIASGEDIEPPRLPAFTPTLTATLAAETFRGLGEIIRSVREIEAAAEEVLVEGGWVFARGSGVLSDRRSSLHRRHRLGIQRHHRYFSVDTGKYSVAPWLAEQLVVEIVG